MTDILLPSSKRSKSGKPMRSVGGTSATTNDQEHLDSPMDIATSSHPTYNDTSTTVPDPNQSHNPTTAKNATDVEPTEAIKPTARRETGPGGERLTNILKKPTGNVDNMKSRPMPAKSFPVWDTYVKLIRRRRRRMKIWSRIGIALLTLPLAALFSAVITGFVLESSKNLQTDQSKAAVLAIRDLTSIVQAGINVSLGMPPSNVPLPSSPEDPFQPTTATIWVNCLWFFSLGLSISASLLAMLAKRWCYAFSRGSRRTGTSYERAIERQNAWNAIERWKMEMVIEQLPTLMHVALMLFFFGLVIYLSEIHQTTTIATAALAGTTVAVYWLLTVLPVWIPAFPMATPFTRAILIWYSYLSQIWNPKSLFWKWMSLFWKHNFQPSLDTVGRIKWAITRSKQYLMRQLENFATEYSFLFSRATGARPDHSASVQLEGVRLAMYKLEQAYSGTSPLPPPRESHTPDFSALVWILTHCNDKPVVRKVLEYINTFPEVILSSSESAISDQLYTAVFVLAGHLDPAETGQSADFEPLLARLIYLAARPWLHEERRMNPRYAEIQSLLAKHNRSLAVETEVETWLDDIKAIGLTGSAASVSGIESLAARMVLDCSPEISLRICSVLGKEILAQTSTSQGHDPTSDMHLALWWIFLNCQCTPYCIPNMQSSDDNNNPESYAYVPDTLAHPAIGREPQANLPVGPTLRVLPVFVSPLASLQPLIDLPDGMTGTFAIRIPNLSSRNTPRDHQTISARGDPLLTWNYFRSSDRRRENPLWLTVVGISKILHSFTYYSVHEDGPNITSNGDHFNKLIGILHSSLHALAGPGSPNLSDGEFPVHIDTDVRLFKCDSLEYGLDVLRDILDSPAYRTSGLLGNLTNLRKDFSMVKAIKQLKSLHLGEGNTQTSIQECYITNKTQCSSEFWLSSGLFSQVFGSGSKSTLSKEHAIFLSKLVPDILFDTPSTASTNQLNHCEFATSPRPIWESYVQACVEIAIWTCMPCDYDLNAFRTAFNAANESYTCCGALWGALNRAGLTRISLEHAPEHEDPKTQSNRPRRTSLPAHATGHWLRIKASIIERFHLVPTAKPHSLDILEWSVALADHFAELLDDWENAEMDGEEQTYVIGSLTKLINTLLAAPNPNSNEINEPSSSHQGTTSVAQVRLEKLLRWGVLRVLAFPFAEAFPSIATSERIPDKNAWYRDLTEAIDRLARKFPELASSEEHSPTYSGLITYYEARAAEDPDGSSSMLKFVQRLRDDMMMHQLA